MAALMDAAFDPGTDYAVFGQYGVIARLPFKRRAFAIFALNNFCRR